MATQTQTQIHAGAIGMGKSTQFDIPKTCKAGVVVNEGAFVCQTIVSFWGILGCFSETEKMASWYIIELV
jgi:hypothetical protein